MHLHDPAAEKACLAGIYKYGKDCYIDIADIIQQPSSFLVQENQILYSCFSYIFEKTQITKLDLATLYSAASDLSVDVLIKNQKAKEHIEQILNFNVELSNVFGFAAKIRKLAVARLINNQLEEAQNKINDLTGNETLSSILGIAENYVFDLTKLINNNDEDPTNLGSIAEEYIKEKEKNPVDQIGISTGFPLFDSAIGGGLRPGTINVVGARAKTFKSGFALAVGKHVANLGLPVLYMDTELQQKEQLPRLIASESMVKMEEIETGKFSKSFSKKQSVERALEKIKKLKLEHKYIGDLALEEQIATMRRWLYKKVGIDYNGKSKPCMIIFDYIKLLDPGSLKNIQEYQAIGFMVSSLHNFAKKYDVPILTFVQLNRDGLSRESTDVISQSDRILWFCSNLSIFKRKDIEEIAADGGDNFKLVTIACRHGKGLQPGDYINVKVEGDYFKLTEGKLKSEVGEVIDEPGEISF